METRTPVPVYSAMQAFPVSVKGVIVQAGKVLLLENERNEWKLPGGKLELGENPPDCVVREISEETGWQVTIGLLLDCWQYHIGKGRDRMVRSPPRDPSSGIPASSPDCQFTSRL